METARPATMRGSRPRQPSLPLVSIIVPTYNDRAHFTEKLNELARQTWPRLQIVVIDDGSTDPVREDLLNSTESWEKVVCLRHAENQGLFIAVATALEHVEGEYVYVSSCNDPIEPDFIESGVRALEAHQAAALCFSDAGVIVGWEGTKKERRFNLSDKTVYFNPSAFAERYRAGPFHISTNTIIYRSGRFKSCGGYRPKLGIFSDIFSSFFLCFRDGAVYLPGVRAYSRIHADGLSKRPISSGERWRITRDMLISMMDEDRAVIPLLRRAAFVSSFGLPVVLKATADRNLRPLVSTRALTLGVARQLWWAVSPFFPDHARYWLNTHLRKASRINVL